MKPHRRFFEVRNVTQNTPFEGKIRDAHTMENDRLLLENLHAIQPHVGKDFALKRLDDINPPFRLLFEVEEVATEESYIPLSYCWHDNSKWTPARGCELGESRYCKGLPISDQCFQEVLRYRKRGEGIWIDILSIDQENEEDKKRAISMMDLVYRGARLIVIVIEDTAMSKSEATVIKNFNAAICEVRSWIRSQTFHEKPNDCVERHLQAYAK